MALLSLRSGVRIPLPVSEVGVSNANSSWLLDGKVCETCGYPIVVTQGDRTDYRYYCSNLECFYHREVQEAFDDEECSFARRPA